MNRNPLLLALATSALLAAGTAVAESQTDTTPRTSATQNQQSGRQDGSMQPQAANRGTQQASLTEADRKFLDKAMKSSAAEIELGRIAEQKATDDEVREFGQMMQMDHSKANKDLKALQASATATAQLSPEQRRTADRLQKLDGPAFDEAYTQEMVTMHRKDVELFEKASKDDAYSASVRQAARAKLAVLREHLREAESLQNRVAAVDEE